MSRQQRPSYTSGMGVEVKLPRGATRDALEAAINQVLQMPYARELWVVECRAELDDVTTDDHRPTGQHVVTCFSVASCLPGYGMSIRFGDYHWPQLQQHDTVYDKINVGCGDLSVARWGFCCSRHEPGQPELRSRRLTKGLVPDQTAEWFAAQLVECLK